jgi:hypothetical protein
MNRVELGGGDFRLETKSAVCVVKRVAPRVGLAQLTGDLDDELYAPVASFMTQLIEPSGTLHFFIDAEHVKSYTPGIRINWTRWFEQHRDRVQCHVMVKSALVKMAIMLLKIAVGDVVQPYSDRNAFETRLRQAAQQQA